MSKTNIVSVLPAGPFNKTYLYRCNFDIKIGDLIQAPFGGRHIIGAVIDTNLTTSIELKEINQVFPFNIGIKYIDFLKWVNKYTLIPLGSILKMMVSEKTVFTAKIEDIEDTKTSIINQSLTLNQDQSNAKNLFFSDNSNKPFLLHGITGSGKTEVYLSIIQKVQESHSQALILLPEIALTKQLESRIEKYFGFKPLIWNSNITKKNKRQIWKNIINKNQCIVIGTRSSLFLPFKDLGIIVIDEEHDSSYKQEDSGFYNARDMAIVLGKILKIKVLLSSATPSIETYQNAISDKYQYYHLKNRFLTKHIPSIETIDMRENIPPRGFISNQLLQKIKSTISKNEQCLIYLNRRGYSPLTLCKKCGWKVQCPDCVSYLTYHKYKQSLQCHHCGYMTKIPKKCEQCNEEDSMIQFGPGIERIMEELSIKIPNAKLSMASSDITSSNKKINEFFEKIQNNEINIIIGTQILAKGHHFPNITLVGIVDGDLGLYGADLRSSEKTYQAISQVAGRAGRGDKKGEILIQTFDSSHSIYKALKAQDSADFLKMETESRLKSNMPPFSRLCAIIISGTNQKLTENIAYKIKENFPQNIKDVSIFGPAPAPLFLLKHKTRWRLLIKSSKNYDLSNLVKKWIESHKIPRNIKIQIDMDPISFF